MILSVKALGKKNSNDNSGRSINVIKNAMLKIGDLLTFICNMSLSNGYFPKRIKIAKVVPIHMSGDKHILTNYRPI